MSENPNSSSAPNVGGTNKSAADKSNGKGKQNPESKSKPRPRQAKLLGLTTSKWRELLAFAVLIPWIYNDIFDAHNFGKSILLASSLAISQGVIVTFIKNRVAALAIWLITLIPLAFAVWYSCRPEIPIENVAVGLEVGPVIDPKAPFGTSLIIWNQGNETVSNIYTTFYWSDPKSKLQIYRHQISAPIPHLSPDIKMAVHLAPEDIKINPPFDPTTTVEVELRYTPANMVETNQIFQFGVHQDTSGNYVWLPAGDGVSQDSMMRIDSILSFLDLVPLLDARLDSVEDISAINKNFPIKINYSWKNVGGITANNVDIEWSLVTKNYLPYMDWSYETNTCIQPLWPGATNGISRIYTDSPEHDVFKGIMSGELILVGVAFFTDENQHSYVMQFKAIRTNDAFEIRYVGTGGYFQELEKKLAAKGIKAGFPN